MTQGTITADAVFYDGQVAQAHRVIITCEPETLVVSGDTLSATVTWPYDDIRSVDDLSIQGGASYRIKDGKGRLNLSDPSAIAQINKRCTKLKKSDLSHTHWKRIGLWGAGAIVSVLLIMFVIIPALANRLAAMIPINQEIALGRGSLKQIERFIGFGDDKPLTCTGEKGQAALDIMTARLVAHIDSPYPLNIRVYDHEMPNAFAVPGGHIVLFDGLIQEAGSPEEVAAVLAHELGHVINRDPTRLTLRSAGSLGILGMVFGDFAGGALALVIAEQMIAANYSQKAEKEADQFAHTLMGKANLPSSPMADFFDRLTKEIGDEPEFLSHLASHPDLAGRATAARAADKIGDASFDAVLTAKQWADLKSMCSKTDTKPE